jgi:hypothetical protein
MIDYTDHECRLKLDELYRGDSVVLPSSEEHAKFMILVAQNYLDQKYQETFDALTKI